MTRYRCPSCKTNRSRFNLIRQVPQPVRLDPQTGDIIHEYTSGEVDPFHRPYTGPELKVQCGICGTIGDELTFIKFGNS
ncbi:DNA alkylation repair protein [Bacillus sp. T33-2]|uniref:DNA alkylation repair protein n=1 Tax=Bacillus sp. T33-2 TaxID=2054168 RepID=UPI000C762814|nr:DNA alkylation repair protein [Bacillus sp. T33-2]PLR98859.1 DNA alkylation repair protein [Bacillus sp. T33-2]